MAKFVDNISRCFDPQIALASEDAPFKLGILGGTFDPVHNGHLALAQAAYESFALDGVLFVPTGVPVRKLDSKPTSAEDRYAMLVAALAPTAYFDVSRIEIDRVGLTYTIDTLRALHETYGLRAELYFIAGKDTTDDIPTWKDAEEIAALVTVLSASRSGYKSKHDEVKEQKGGLAASSFTILNFEMPAHAVSSTDIRKRIQCGKSVHDQLPWAVEQYIKEHHLYGHE